MKPHSLGGWCALAGIVVCLLPDTAQAYVGPGSGLSAFGAFLALIAGIVVALFGFVWYPVKRLLKRRASVEKEPPGGEA